MAALRTALVVFLLAPGCGTGSPRPDPRIARQLERLGSPDPDVRKVASDALVDLGPVVLFQLCPYIAEHLDDRSERAWRAAFRTEERIARRYQDAPDLDAYYRSLEPVELPVMHARLPGGLKMEFVRLPAGTYIQGAHSPGTGIVDARELPCNYAPVRKVTLSEPFWIGRDVVSQEQWEALMPMNRCREKVPHYPVDTISWDEAMEFCRRLSGHNPGRRFTLPTEAQWEYACRAGTTSRHAFGNQELIRGDYRLDEGGEWHENRFGLRHVHNLVFEWCRDWFSIPTEAACVDPVGPRTGRYRSVRSNYQFCSAARCRSAHRVGFPPRPRNGIGLRVVCPAE